jgi:hypothetical protein
MFNRNAHKERKENASACIGALAVWVRVKYVNHFDQLPKGTE